MIVELPEKILLLAGCSESAPTEIVLSAIHYKLTCYEFLQEEYANLSAKFNNVFDEAFFMGCEAKDKSKVAEALIRFLNNRKKVIPFPNKRNER